MKQNKKQQIKSSFKIAFQANIFRFIQKKKNQISLFAVEQKKSPLSLSQKKKYQGGLILENLNILPSNLILQSDVDLPVLQKQKNKFKRRKFTHKTTLSDWRTLYQTDSDQLLKQKNQRQTKELLFKDFRPQTKQALLQNTFHSTFYQNLTRIRKKQNNSVAFSKTMSHMNIDSVSPKIKKIVIKKSRSSVINPEQKTKNSNFLTLNISKQKQLRGLHMMNEGIMINPLSGNDINFQPYFKKQKKELQNNRHNLDEEMQIKKYSNQNFLSKKQSQKQKKIQVQNKQNRNLCNLFGTTFSNFSYLQKRQNKQINLKMQLFKSRKNKIEQKRTNQSIKKLKKSQIKNKNNSQKKEFSQKYLFTKNDRGKQLSLNRLIIQ